MFKITDLTGFDFETHLIGPGNMAPAPVVGAFTRSRSIHKTDLILRGDALFERLRAMYRDEHHVGQNVAFDNVVALKQYPELIPLIFDAYHDQRVHDTAINEGLYNLSVVGEIGPNEKRDSLASLADLAKKYRGLDLSEQKGADGWRLRYHELDGIPVALWPKDAIDYPKQDAWLVREIRMEQENSPVEWLHVAAAFCYFLMTVRGLQIDRKRTKWLWAKVEKDLSPEALPLLYRPLHTFQCIAQSVSPEGPDPGCDCPSLVKAAQPARPGKTKAHVVGCKRGKCACPPKLLAPQPEKMAKGDALVPLIMQVCTENDLEIAMTEPTASKKHEKDCTDKDSCDCPLRYPNGQVKTDEETISKLAGLHPTLGQYHTRIEWDKLRTSYFPAMCWPYGSGKIARTMYPGFEPLKNTGRGSSRGNSKRRAAEGRCVSASANIQQADPRMRACYKPRQGHVYVVADFQAIDLVNLAQTVYRMFGENTLTDHVNAGVDLHAFYSARIAAKRDPAFAKRVAGMDADGAYREFVKVKKEPHKKGCTKDTREAGHNCGVGGCWYKKIRDLAKKAGLAFAGGMGIDTLIGLVARELKMKLTIPEAQGLKKDWLHTYPIMRRYLDWAAHNVDNNATGDFNKFYVSPLGMRRTRCSYTQCANGNALQTPAAEGMKIAMFLVTRECYDLTLKSVLFGCFPVINMHDELVVEAPNLGEDYLDAVARRLEALMVRGQKVICPDVSVKAEPYLTTRWVKDAGPVKDDQGRLVPWIWTPEEGDYDGE